MAHANRWRCPCGAYLGIVRRIGQETALDLNRDAVKRLLLGPRGTVGVCDACGNRITFEPQIMACTTPA